MVVPTLTKTRDNSGTYPQGYAVGTDDNTDLAAILTWCAAHEAASAPHSGELPSDSPSITGSPSAASATWTNLGTVTLCDINGGSVDGTTIGAAAAGAGTFTTCDAATGTFADGHMYGQPLMFSRSYVLPEYIQDQVDFLPMMVVDASWAPYGIRITKVGMALDANRAYAIRLEKWTTANPPAHDEDILTADLDPGAAASTATTTSTFTTTTTYYDVAVDHIVGVDLPTTTGALVLTVWFTYELKSS